MDEDPGVTLALLIQVFGQKTALKTQLSQHHKSCTPREVYARANLSLEKLHHVVCVLPVFGGKVVVSNLVV